MRLRIAIILALTRVVEFTGRLVSRVQFFLYGLLPAILPPEELMRLTRRFYDRSYQPLRTAFHSEAYPWTLEQWEEDVVTRHCGKKGTVVVIGAGLGRESIAFAQRGHRVLGLDHNPDGLRIAARRAAGLHVPVTFLQADFMALPLVPSSADCIIMSGAMYSAIPGRQQRQTCLRQFHSALREGGKAVLNFLVAGEPDIVAHRALHTLNTWIRRLPGGNPTYQLGDFCAHSHFMHAFVSESDLRAELTEAGVAILELNWLNGFVVIA